jgi:hypothetical protein
MQTTKSKWRRVEGHTKFRNITKSVVDVVVECVAVAVVGEAVVVRRELLQALGGHGGEVAGDLGMVGQHGGAARHEAIHQLALLPHLSLSPAADAWAGGVSRLAGLWRGDV